jgi:hypothetical protein
MTPHQAAFFALPTRTLLSSTHAQPLALHRVLLSTCHRSLSSLVPCVVSESAAKAGLGLSIESHVLHSAPPTHFISSLSSLVRYVESESAAKAGLAIEPENAALKESLKLAQIETKESPEFQKMIHSLRQQKRKDAKLQKLISGLNVGGGAVFHSHLIRFHAASSSAFFRVASTQHSVEPVTSCSIRSHQLVICFCLTQ